jgi:hypothetical protein
MKRIFSAWHDKLSSWVWRVACAEGILLVTLYVVIAACAPKMHFTYFATKLGRALLMAMMLICLVSLLTLFLALFAYGKERIAGLIIAFAIFALSFGMVGIAE